MTLGKNSSVKNTIINFLGNIFLVLIIMVATPLLVDKFGNEVYGLWRIAMLTLVSYVVLFDAGMNASVKRQLGDAINSNNLARAKNIIGQSFIFYLGLGTLAIIAAASTVFWLPNFIYTPPELLYSFNILLISVGFFICFSFFQIVLSAVFTVWARYDLVQTVIVLSRFFLFAFIFLFMLLPVEKLVAAAISAVVSPLLVVLISFAVIKHYWKDFTFDFSLKDKSIMKHFFSFGSAGLLMLLGPVLLNQTQPLIIAQMLDLNAVTFFSVVFIITSQMASVVSSCSSPFIPIVSKFRNQNNLQGIQNAFNDALRRSYFALAIFAIPLCIYGGYFFKFWIAPEFESSETILWVMMISVFALPMAFTSNHILTAGGEIKMLGIYSLIMGISSIILSYALLIFTDWGLMGVAFAASFPLLVNSLYSINYLCKQFNMSIFKVLAHTLWLFPIFMLCLVFYNGLCLLNIPKNLFETFIHLALNAAFVAGLGALTLLSNADKNMLKRKIFRSKS